MKLNDLFVFLAAWNVRPAANDHRMKARRRWSSPGRACQLPHAKQAALSTDLSVSFKSGCEISCTKEGERSSLQSTRQSPNPKVLNQFKSGTCPSTTKRAIFSDRDPG